MKKGLVYRKPRIIFVEQATIWAAKQSMICQTINLSETGLLLIPPFSSEPGLTLRVDIPLPGLQRPLAIPAVLVREGEHEGEYAWGVRFELISADAQKFLRQFLQEQVARQFPEELLSQEPERPISAPQQAVITPTAPLVQPTAPVPSRPRHKPIDRSAARRVPVRRGTGSQPVIATEVTDPTQLPPEVQPGHPQPVIALTPEDLGSQPDFAPAAPAPSRVPAYSGPLTGDAPPPTAPTIAPALRSPIKQTATGPQQIPAYTGPITGEPPPRPSPPPRTGSHPAVSPAPGTEAPPVAADEPQLSVTLPADELLLDRPPVQEEGTPNFDDVPEWSDKSDVPRSQRDHDRDLLEEVSKADDKLDDIFKDAVKQLDLSDSWADHGFSKKSKKKKKKGWF